VISAVDIKDLRFSYGTKSPEVISIPELQIPRGEKTFLSGSSGSGKTTLLSLLTGVLTTQAGEIQVLGQNLKSMNEGERDRFRGERIGYIFQSFNLLPFLTVTENISLACQLNPKRAHRLAGKSISEEALRLCERLDIHQFLKRSVRELSVGQQQRVAAARALLGSPELLIADEPTSALDHEHREDFIQLLFEEVKRTGANLLFVSHDKSLASLFDRSLSLESLNRVPR
jgi:putative ABC transport system ATP-binding protein